MDAGRQDRLRRLSPPGCGGLAAGNWFFPAVFALSFAYIVFLFADYNTAWIHPEVSFRQLPYVAADGVGLAWSDLPRMFNALLFDEIVRARFLSYGFAILGLQLRLWLYGVFPPPPGLSPVSLLNLLISPVVFYRFIKILTGRRESAWAGLTLFFLSTGYLSALFLLFHPGKPLLLFLTVVCLYLGARISADPVRGGWRNYWFLLGFLTLALFTDESSLGLFITVPVLFPAIFRLGRSRVKAAVFYLVPPAVFILAVTLVVPPLCRNFGYGEFNFWESAFLQSMYPITERPPGGLWSDFEFGNIIANAVNLFRAQLTVPSSGGGWLLNLFGVILVPLYCLVSFFFLGRERRRLVLRFLAALAIFFAVETLIHAKHFKVLKSSYYYGSLFPLYLVPVLTVLLVRDGDSGRWRSRLLVTILLVVFLVTFVRINRSWRDSHQDLPFGFERKRTMVSRMGEGELTIPGVRRAWELRNDQVALFDQLPRYPRRSIWLFQEISCLR